MPTTIATPSNANTKVRHNEPYVSAALNQKTAGPIPNGIIRGGTLTTTGAGLNVQIGVDPDSGDSVYTYTTPTGFQLTHRETGIRVLDLSALTGQTVYIALYALYAVGVPTVVEWRAYTEAELFGGSPVSEADSVVVVGRVVVPGVGPIPAANVSYMRARRAWKDVASGMRPWRQLAQNGSFESGPTTIGNFQAITGYRGSEVNAAAISVVAGASQHGSYYLNVALTGATDIGRIGPGLFTVANPFSSGILPIVSGQLIDISFYIEGVGVPAYTLNTSGVRLIVEIYDGSNPAVLLATEQVVSDPTVHVGTFSWTKLDRIFAAPASGYMRWYLECGNDGGACSWHVDDISVLLESRAGDQNNELLTRPTYTASAFDLVPYNVSPAGIQSTMERLLRISAELSNGGVGVKFTRNDIDNGVRWLSSFMFDSGYSPAEATYGLLGMSDPPASSGYMLLHKYAINSSSFARVFASGANNGMAFTTNCSWDGAQWVRDVSGRPAMKLSFGCDVSSADPTFLRIQHKNDAVPANWLDSAWDRSNTLRANAFGDLEYTTKIRRKRFYALQEVMNFNWSVFGQSAVSLSAATLTFYMTHTGIGQIWFPLIGMVPDGSDLIEFQVGFSATGGTSVNPVVLQLLQTQPDTATIPLSILAGQTTALATRSQVQPQPFAEHIKLTDGTGLPQTLDYETYNYQLYYEASLQGGGGAAITYAQITFDDPGPGGR